MNILLTGATGYIGKRLLPELINLGHHVICVVRDKARFSPPEILLKKIEVVEADFLDFASLQAIPKNIEAAYYLIHSMSASSGNFQELEKQAALNFKKFSEATKLKHVVYLSGIVNDKSLSKHLKSRKNVEETLKSNNYHLTTLRAGIIIGSGSASFEIMRDLVEKLPLMIAPKWINTRSQPIAISDVILFLIRTLDNHKTFDQSFDIGGPEILTYKEMLLIFAHVRKLQRYIITVPVMTPKLSSYWLYFVTSTSYKLATALVESMSVEVICRNNALNKILRIDAITYKEALLLAFQRINKNKIISSWKDSFISGQLNNPLSEYIEVPKYGCFTDKRTHTIKNKEKVAEKIWSIGGKNGWYYASWLWKVRGFIDKLFGGVGLRRGRTNTNKINVGDALDFWRVLYANKNEARLLLFAEMKLPGEAWLEFKITKNTLYQTATFRPRGISGRMYWFFVYPFHAIIFGGLIKKLSKIDQ